MEKEILYRYFNGAVTPEEEFAIKEWAESSPENYKSYLEARKVWCALLLYAKPKKTGKTVLGGRMPLRYIAGLSAAAALLFIVITALITTIYPFSRNVQQVTVPRGQRVEMTLADGSKVWLNSTSRLEYSPLFGLTNRNIRLSGEAYFEVAEDSKPFIVTTDNYDVKVYGTTFNVYAFEDSPIFETSLIEGSVEVIPHNGEGSMMLQPNQIAVATTDGSLVRKPLGNTDHLRWIDGMICLNNVCFGELLARFSSYFDTEIKLLDSSLYDVRCTGKFRHSDGIDYSLRILQNLVQFNYTYNTRENSIEIY